MKTLIYSVIILLFIVETIIPIRIRNKQLPNKPDVIQNAEHKQAPIPPTISVIMDIPQYGEDGLDKWGTYMNSNLQMAHDFFIRNRRSHLWFYQNRLNRIGAMEKALTVLGNN